MPFRLMWSSESESKPATAVIKNGWADLNSISRSPNWFRRLTSHERGLPRGKRPRILATWEFLNSDKRHDYAAKMRQRQSIKNTKKWRRRQKVVNNDKYSMKVTQNAGNSISDMECRLFQKYFLVIYKTLLEIYKTYYFLNITSWFMYITCGKI